MLKIKDLAVSKELDRKAMTTVVGGFDPFATVFDGSTRLDNKVADIKQVFAFDLSQVNAGAVTNNQIIEGGNGPIDAPVHQELDQNNNLSVSGLGNTSIGGSRRRRLF